MAHSSSNITPQPTQPSCNGTAMSAYLINGSQIGFIIKYIKKTHDNRKSLQIIIKALNFSRVVMLKIYGAAQTQSHQETQMQNQEKFTTTAMAKPKSTSTTTTTTNAPSTACPKTEMNISVASASKIVHYFNGHKIKSSILIFIIMIIMNF
uniref:CSON011795 protein n=1 Tax=Culicoides sonorensis TaxID=179676 RepID=A0A336N0G8_CULSO